MWPSATSQNYIVEEDVVYSVQVTSVNGCMDTSDPMFIDFVGVDEINHRLFDVYPNPVDQSINIRSNALNAGDQIMLFDVTGKLVKSVLLTSDGAGVINCTALPTGVYYVQYKGQQEKIIKL